MERSWQRNFRAAESSVPKAQRRQSAQWGGGQGVQHPVPVGDGVQKPEKKALFLQGSIAPSSWGKESWDPKAGTHSFGR